MVIISQKNKIYRPFGRVENLKNIARSDCLMSAGLIGCVVPFLSLMVNTHVAQFVRVILGAEQICACQDDKHHQDYGC